MLLQRQPRQANVYRRGLGHVCFFEHWQFLPSRIFGAVFLLLIFSVGFITRADEHTALFGVSMPVDGYEVVDAKTSVIKIDGQSRLIERSQLTSILATTFLKPGEMRFSPKDLFHIIGQASKLKDFPVAARGIITLCDRKFNHPEKKTYIISLSDLSSVLLIKEIIGILSDSERFDEACVESLFSGDNLSGVIFLKRNLSFLYQFSSTLKSNARRVTQSSIATRNWANADNVLAALKESFGDEDSDIQSLTRVIEKGKSFFKNLDEERYSEARRIFDESVQDSMLSKGLVDGGIEKARSEAKHGKLDSALTLFALLMPKTITPEDGELLLTLISSSSSEQFMSLDFIRIKLLIERMLEQHPALRTRLGESLSILFEKMVLHGEHEKSQAVLSLLFLTDPADAMSKINSLSEAYYRADKPEEAVEIYKRFNISPSFRQRFQWFLLQYGLIISVVSGLLAVALGGSIFYRERTKDRDAAARRLMNDDESEREGAPRFTGHAALMRTDSISSEYLELLLFFGLTKDATEKEIKQAFRKLIKEVHPDVSTSSSKEEDSFIKTKDAYERLLALYADRQAIKKKQ